MQAIIDNPDDEGLRLVYADWLEEQDETERAELIRVQCRLGHLAEDDAERPGLELRERVLEGAFLRSWRKGVENLGTIWGWQMFRGLPEGVTLSSEDFLRHGPKLFSRSP